MGGRGPVIPDEPRPPRGDACNLLQIETNLMSPQAEAMKAIRSGQALPVKLKHDQTHRFAVVVNLTGQVVGTIGSDRAIDLIECIDKGYSYIADVLSIEGGACRVLVHLEGR